MDAQDFSRLSDECLDKVVAWIETFDPDELDCETTDGVVNIEFPDGKKFVLNRQAGSHQMWFAAGVRAFHYDWDPSSLAWRDSRDAHDLYDRIAEAVSEKLGRRVDIA